MARPWFKHFSNASQGASLRRLWDEGHFAAYSLYWMILEMVARWEDKNSPGSMTINWSVLARETGWKRPRCRSELARITSVTEIVLEEFHDGSIKLTVPKWSELQTSWGGKIRARLEQDAGRSKKLEVRSKKLDMAKQQKPKPLSAAADLPHPLVQIWNTNRGQLPEVRGCTGDRMKHATARMAEQPSTEYWGEIVCRIRESPFCNGQNDRGWVATFDFLIQPNTQNKVLEGKYDARNKKEFVSPENLAIRKALEEEDRLAKEQNDDREENVGAFESNDG